MKERILVSNIQRFSLHDGPGIRTTVFLMGCSVKCPWCSNPENLEYKIRKYIKNDCSEEYGKYLSVEELLAEIVKDKDYYGSCDCKMDELSKMPGGVTFSGGEPLLQTKILELLWRKLKIEEVNIAVETALFVENELVKTALNYVDLFYIDIKLLDREDCQRIIGGNIDQYLKNIEYLFKNNAKVVFRIPVIGNFTNYEKNKKNIMLFLKKYKPLKVELIKEHNLGKSKYLSLDLIPPKMNGVDDSFLEQYKEDIRKLGLSVEICRV